MQGHASHTFLGNAEFSTPGAFSASCFARCLEILTQQIVDSLKLRNANKIEELNTLGY